VAPDPARPLLRPLAVWILAVPCMVPAILLGFLLAPLVGRRRAFWMLAPGWVRLAAAAFGLRRHLAGWEDLPESLRTSREPAIFIANHASSFDPPLLISTLPCRPVFIAKKELAYLPFLGWLIWLAGFIFVDRGRQSRAVASLRRAARKIREGQSIAAFPEGTRTRTGRILPFKRGVFALAKTAEVPVVPMAIQGGFDALPPGAWRVRPGDYTIRVGAPLMPRDYPSAQAMMEAAESEVHRLFARE